MKTETLENPAIFLKEMQDEAAQKTKLVKELSSQINTAIANFKYYGETVLFRGELPDIKCRRYHNIVPKPYYIIRGLEITAQPWHNNCFNGNACCKVDVKISLLIEHNRREERHYFDDNPSLFWNCHLPFFKMEEIKYREKLLGVLTNLEKEKEGSWDCKLLFLDDRDFPVFKETVKRGLESLGVEFE